MTSPDVRVLGLKFIIDGQELDDEKQVRVTIILRVAGYIGKKQMENYLQTTITSRQPES